MSEPRNQWSIRNDYRPQPEWARIQSDEMLADVSRSEAETAEVYRRIEDQLRGVARRLDASERSQTESSRVMSKAAVEMNIAAREQAQAFDQLGTHVANIAERLDKVEERDPSDGLRDAVKALHQGLSRLAEQITGTANQSATQISNLAGNLETVAGRVGQARQDAMAATQALETRFGAVDERVRALETATQAHASSIDRALAAIEDQKHAASPMEAIVHLEDSVRRLEDRGADPSIDRRLNGIERTMADLTGRIESRDDSASSLDEGLRKVVARLEGLETAQRETAAELRKAAAAIKPMEPPPPPPPPVIPPEAAMPPVPPAAGFSPLPGFEPPPFAAEVPPFAVASATPPPFAMGDTLANAYELPPDPNFTSPPGLAADVTAEAPTSVESYLAAARRSARAAAAQETERGATIGALHWGSNAAKPPADATPKKKSSALLIGLLALGIIVFAAALFLRWQAMNTNAAHPAATAAVVGSLAKAPAKTDAPSLHQTATEGPVPPVPQVIRPAEPSPSKPVPVQVAALPPPAAHPAAPQAVAPWSAGPQPVAARPGTAITPLDRLTQAANAGNSRAQLIVGLKYLEGDGVPANQTEAAKWLTKAADAGEPVAQYRLGGLFESGLGVAKDPVKAVRLYLAAANQGSRKAMHNLAVAYAAGTGVKKDYAEASRWFLKAANLGLSDSQFNLAVLYERGLGVPQNLVDAYKWYAIAAAQGDTESKARITAITSQLDADTRAAAQHAAETFRAGQLNARANVAPTISDVTRG